MQLRREHAWTVPVCNKSHRAGRVHGCVVSDAGAPKCRAARAHNRSRLAAHGRSTLRVQTNATRPVMNALDKARPFYRSEAFPEDVADFVDPSPRSSTGKAAPMPRRQRHVMLWLLGLLPLVALAIGASWAI
jgi:hypothetical protein